jgi:hypothetical protein
MGAKRSGQFTGRRGVLAGVLVAAAGMLAGLAPEPEVVPRRWELRIEPGPLRIASITVPDRATRQYLFMTYRVINNSGQDVLFAPTFELANGEGDIQRSGREVPQAVTDRLKQEAQNPLVEDQIQIIGELMQGEENAKHGVVVWPVTDLTPTDLIVYASGFSGETATVENPVTKTRAVLRKTARIEFENPGNLVGQGGRPMNVAAKQWIMR